MNIPTSNAEWKAQVAARQLQSRTIFDLKSYHSGSRISDEQYLLLRALWIVGDRHKFLSSKSERYVWFQQQHFDRAKKLLRGDDEQEHEGGLSVGWKAYKDSLQHKIPEPGKPYPSQLGTFSLVHYYQQAVVGLEGITRASEKTHSYNTRSKDKRTEPNTTPSKPPKRRFSQYEDLLSSSPSRLTGLDASPASTIFITPNNPRDAEYLTSESPTEDEQIVNTALISYLNAITIHFVRDVEWSLKRSSFQIKEEDQRLFEARVDGNLHRREDGTILAIIEVKPYDRKSHISAIRKQEAAQMACWISSCPQDIKSQNKGQSSRYRRLLVSQDKGRIYLTFAEFDDAYIEYIRTGLVVGDGPFLEMNEAGGFKVNNSRHMEKLGYHLLAFTLEQCDRF